MRKKLLLIPATALTAALAIGASYHLGEASDHDDGETDLKSRALNLTDHFAFKSPTNPNELALIMYFNPRSLPGRQYSLSTNARYELHVSRAAQKTDAPTVKDDLVFRFEGAAPDAAGVQKITLTILKDGQVIGTHTGASTAFAASKANTITTNTGNAGGIDFKYFVGQRADSFHFDVVRFFQVRAFLADRFFGGANGDGNPAASLAPNCRGDAFLTPLLGAGGETAPADGDLINLFNPPSCAPDFTKNLNVTAIALNVPIAQLGGTIFDTWSTISVGE
ncbi:MAG TPA: DUF4331 family protein [Kofleriaceae bacterium]|nr:DUF4331 family protein [Kofleriaceae bacterium]